jgi:hypothetical protein
MTSGILRSESLYRAELIDFMGVTLNDNKNDIYPMFVMVNQIAIGFPKAIWSYGDLVVYLNEMNEYTLHYFTETRN